MANAPHETAGVKFTERLGTFIQKNRTVLLTIVVVVFVGIAGTGTVYAILQSSGKKAAAKVEALADSYEEIRVLQGDAKKTERTDALLADLKKAGEGRGFTAARALSVAAAIQADKKDWTEAEKLWVSAAEAAPTSYLAPASLYNAAAAAEERGDGKRALELYCKCVDAYSETFPLAPRALFAVGRIQEGTKDYAAATAAYNKIIERWPNDGWTKLARSRILTIAATGNAN
jgi:tetratricopeptide (TPR) repeat protein